LDNPDGSLIARAKAAADEAPPFARLQSHGRADPLLSYEIAEMLRQS